MIPNDKLIQIADKLTGQLYPYQAKLLSSNEREIIVNKSRQVGVSYAVACWALLQAIFNERTELIISPSLRQSKHMMDYIYYFLNKLREDFTVSLREETKTSLLFNPKGEIHSLPNSANTVRGFPADDVWIDEYAHFTCGTDKDIIEAITPSISRGGQIRKISTPFGDQNLFYKDWNRRDIEKILINWKECPAFDEEDIRSIKRTIGEDAFQQEYNNQFLSDNAGQEFPMALIETCIDNELQYSGLQKDRNYVAGADIGRERDLTALCVLEKKDECYTLRFKETMRQTPYNEQLAFFEHQLKNYNFDSFVIDESGIGNMLAEEIANKFNIERITFNNENKQEMVENLKKIMQEGRLKMPDDPQMISSIRAIRRIYTPSNYLKFDSEHDRKKISDPDYIGHADLFWALAMAVKKADSGRGFWIG